MAFGTSALENVICIGMYDHLESVVQMLLRLGSVIFVVVVVVAIVVHSSRT